MGLHAPTAELLVHEHAHRAVQGRVLFIGRQTTHLDEVQCRRLLARYGLTPPPGWIPEIDAETRGSSWARSPWITDRAFLAALGVDSPRFLDVTAYEGADIVADLGQPVPEEHAGQFDFIYNGSCLDNMFNPAQAIANMTRMLAPGGRVLHVEHATPLNGPYLMYSPGWFFDYYVMNGFADCRVYLCAFRNGVELTQGPWQAYAYNWEAWRDGPIPLRRPPGTPGPGPAAGRELVLAVLAEKASASTADVQPLQFQYRPPELEEVFQRGVERMAESTRSWFGGEGRAWDEPFVHLGAIQGTVEAADGASPPSPRLRRSRTLRRWGMHRANGHCWRVVLPASWGGGDSADDPTRSSLALFEDGRELGPAHSFVAEIERWGHGRYCHWERTLFFSTSDRTDPRSNGRRYTIRWRS